MTPHPHAEVLRAIADGVPLSEFEVHHHKYFIDWVSLVGRENAVFSNETCWTIRRKPRTHVVNGFTVPAPLTSMARGDQYFLAEVIDGMPKAGARYNNIEDLGKRHCKSGVAHATQSAAIANAKAMLKIDPEAV